MSLLSLIIFADSTRADIFQWEYVEPADPSKGKRQSATLAPDGAGLDAVPGAILSRRDLTMAYVNGADLSHSWLAGAKLQKASFRSTNLLGAHLSRSGEPLCNLGLPGGFVCRNTDVTDADFSHANLTNADFDRANASGADFREANLTNVRFYRAVLTAADFTGADLTVVNSLTYAEFASATLSGANLSGTDLWGVDFYAATLTGADLTGARINGGPYGRGAGLSQTTANGFTASQLYSTASYQAHDLRGIRLTGNDLSGWNFVGQNLAHASLSDSVTGADFTGADVRGGYLNPTDAITTNMIQADGHIDGLDLNDGQSLMVRDHNGLSLVYPYSLFLPPIPITIDQHLVMGPGGILRMILSPDAWDSTISLTPGIPVTLGGTLELTFDDGIDVASQLGRTFDIFDWTGVTPTGTFAVSSRYAWDISSLYTTGKVTLTAIPEPSCLALAAVTAFGLTFYRRRNIT